MSRKYILTVPVSDQAGDEVERVLMMIADKLQGRLTRSDFEPSNQADGYVIQTRNKTLRKLGGGA